MAKQKYLVECVNKETGEAEFRAFIARNPVEATSHAQLLGFMVGRVKVAPDQGPEAVAAGAAAPPAKAKPRRTRLAVVVGIAVGGLMLAAGIVYGVRGYIQTVEAGMPPIGAKDLSRAGVRPSSPGPAPAKGEARPQEGEEGVPRIALGETIRLGGTVFTPRRVILAPAMGEEFADRRPSKVAMGGPKLMLECTVKNESEGQVYAPVTAATVRRSYVRDDRGGRTDGFVTPAAGRVVFWDGQSFDQMLAGEEETNLLLCDPPRELDGRAFVWRVFVMGSNDEPMSAMMPGGGRVVDVAFAGSAVEQISEPPRLDIERDRGGVKSHERSIAKRRAGIGGTLELEGVRVRVLGVRRVDQLKCTKRMEDGTDAPRQMDDPQLVLDLELENTSGKPFAPMSYQSQRWCAAEDSFGNRLSPLCFAPGVRITLAGQDLRTLAPGERVKTLIAAAFPKGDPGQRIVWMVAVRAVDEVGDRVFPPSQRALGCVEFDPAKIRAEGDG